MAVAQRPALPTPRFLRRPRGATLAAFAAAALVIGAAGLQVNQFSRLTRTGYEIDQLNRERAAKQAANHEIEAEVASLSSLARVEWEARTRLLMEPAKRRLYIAVNAPVPEQQTLPTRYLPKPAQHGGPLPEPAVERDGGKSVWEKARGLLPF